MRIVGEVPHPIYKISILHHNHKFTLQIESAATSQTYTIREGNDVHNVKDVISRVTPQFLKLVDKAFLGLSDNLIELMKQDQKMDEDLNLIDGVL